MSVPSAYLGTYVNLEDCGINPQDKKFLFKALCRCCMAFTYSPSSINPNVVNLYTKFTEMQWEAENNLPRIMCENCSTKLADLEIFVKECLETDRKLKEMLVELENIPKVEDDIKDEVDIDLGDPGIDEDVGDDLADPEVKIKEDVVDEEPVDEPLNSLNEKDGKFKCEICNRSFLFQSKLSRHLKMHDLKNENHESFRRCDPCKMVFQTRAGYLTHCKRKSCPIEKLKCEICKKTFPKLSRLQRHQKVHAKTESNQDYSCITCGIHFNYSQMLTRHCNITGCTLRLIKCKICGKECTKPSKLKRHMQSHGVYDLKQVLPCDICQKICISQDALTRHKKGHDDSNKGTCYICGKVFKNKISVPEHIKRVHPTEPPPTDPTHKCPQCPKIYTTPLKVKEHILRVHKPKNHLCTFCGKAFTCSAFLKEHIRCHTGEKPFPCSICPKRFRILYQRTLHMRTHTGDAPYKCDVCEMKFKNPGNLVEHKRVHTGEKPFECTVCKKSFASSGTLTVHKRIHTGALPYPCSYCGKDFRSSSARTKHLQSHGVYYDHEKKVCVETIKSKEATQDKDVTQAKVEKDTSIPEKTDEKCEVKLP